MIEAVEKRFGITTKRRSVDGVIESAYKNAEEIVLNPQGLPFPTLYLNRGFFDSPKGIYEEREVASFIAPDIAVVRVWERDPVRWEWSQIGVGKIYIAEEINSMKFREKGFNGKSLSFMYKPH